MTELECRISEDEIMFRCCGHSGYRHPQTGNNDVCVITSAICSFLALYLQRTGIYDSGNIFEDGNVMYRVDSPGAADRDVFETAMEEFRVVQDQYPKYIRILCDD
ncbi:MAG: hypothetical protein ACLS8Q_05480 [Anaerovoracaceae bacterium]|jgi:hypothetical protein